MEEAVTMGSAYIAAGMARAKAKRALEKRRKEWEESDAVERVAAQQAHAYERNDMLNRLASLIEASGGRIEWAVGMRAWMMEHPEFYGTRVMWRRIVKLEGVVAARKRDGTGWDDWTNDAFKPGQSRRSQVRNAARPDWMRDPAKLPKRPPGRP